MCALHVSFSFLLYDTFSLLSFLHTCTLLHVNYQAHVHGVQGAGVPVANSPQNIERVTFNHNRCMYVYTIKYLTILNWELFTNWQNWVIWIFSYIWLMWSLTQSSLYGIQVSSEGRHRMQVDYEKHQWKLLSPGADVNQRWQSWEMLHSASKQLTLTCNKPHDVPVCIVIQRLIQFIKSYTFCCKISAFTWEANLPTYIVKETVLSAGINKLLQWWAPIMFEVDNNPPGTHIPWLLSLGVNISYHHDDIA